MKKSAFLILAALCALAQAADYVTKKVSAKKADYYEINTSYPEWKSTNKLGAFANPVLKKWALGEHNSWLAQVKQDQKDLEKPTMAWYHEIGFSVARSDARILSVVAGMEDYSGGAHPNHWTLCFNFAMVKGKPKQIKLKDLFKPGGNPEKLVSDKVIAKLMKMEGADWVQNGEVKKLDKIQIEKFTIEKDGITYGFDPYVMGPYAAGDFEVKLTWAELGSTLNRALVSAK
ncbi:MAG: hypothetical protein BGO01_03885 [Armatimonadetes bacterium 55-13]|nr:DUF3298 and DUF4163 domain-containing protein [Armatimonadota bacterium]OJU63291.1 MAG: hypothetical protein BGO01_03885 [Armatimonadetes bacterium 55-13]